MQLKALAAILSVACTIGVQAAPNPLDRAADVKGILRRSFSHGKDMSQVSKRAVALVAKKRDSNHQRRHGKRCKPKPTLAPQSQQPQTTQTPEQPQSTEQPQITPTPEQPQTTPTPEQPQPTTTPDNPKAIETESSPAPEVTPSTDVGGNNNDNSGSGSTSLDDLSQQWLDLHNQARAQHGAAAMTWNSDLATFAQNWASGCDFVHSHVHGENLAAQTGEMTPADGFKMWMDEIGDYDPTNPQPSHFTQVVWKGSTQLGCALVACDAKKIFPDFSGTAIYGVCEYDPPGNVIGSFPQNVQK